MHVRAGDLHPLRADVVLLLTTGLRPGEARARRWDHVGLGAGTICVWRSDRAGGDTKTPKSRRTLAQIAVDALRQRKAAQAAGRLNAGEPWQDTGLVFTTAIGTLLDQHNIRRGFRQITRAAGPGDERVPRELRHTLCASCPQAASRSRRSPASPATSRPAPPKWSTAANCAR